MDEPLVESHKLHQALKLIVDYDNLIQVLPFIKTDVFNELLRNFPRAIIDEIQKTLDVDVYLLFNTIGKKIDINNPMLSRVVTVVKINKTDAETYAVKKIIKPAWVFVFDKKPPQTTTDLFIKNKWSIERKKEKYLLIRPGSVELQSICS